MFRLTLAITLLALTNPTFAGTKQIISSYEAEKMQITPGFAEIISNKKYSRGKAVSLLKGRKLSKKELRNPPKPSLVIKFKLAKGGDYILMLNGYSPNSASDSFYYSLNGGRLFRTCLKAGKSFMLKLKERLSGGEQTFNIYTRENNCVIDKLEIIPVMHRHYNRKLTVPNWSAPPFIPPKTRPRVLLNSEYVKKLKKRIEQLDIYGTALKRIKYYAHQKNAGILPQNNIYHASQAKAIRCQAFLYAVTGARVDGEQAIKNLLVLLKRATFIKRLDISRRYGELVYTAGVVYDWCYPLLTSADKKDIVAGIMKKAVCMEIGWPPVRQSSITSHAGEAQLLNTFF